MARLTLLLLPILTSFATPPPTAAMLERGVPPPSAEEAAAMARYAKCLTDVSSALTEEDLGPNRARGDVAMGLCSGLLMPRRPEARSQEPETVRPGIWH